MPAERPRGEGRVRGKDSVSKALKAMGATQPEGLTDGRPQFDVNGQRIRVGETHYEVSTRGGEDGATFKSPWDLPENAARQIVASDVEYMQRRAKLIAELNTPSKPPQEE